MPFTSLTGQDLPEVSITDSVQVMFSYDVHELAYSELDPYKSLDSVDFLDRQFITPRHSLYRIEEGVDENFNSFQCIINNKQPELEPWFRTNRSCIIGPRRTILFDDNGEIHSSFEHSEDEISMQAEISEQHRNSGYSPFHRSFQEVVDDWLSIAHENKSPVTETDTGWFVQEADGYIVLDYSDMSVTHSSSHHNRSYVVVTLYTDFKPYGIVVESETTRIRNLDNPGALTFVTRKAYANHTVNDPNNMILTKESSDCATVYPVPVDDLLEVEISSELKMVERISVRTRFGDLIDQVEHPEVVNGHIQLDASSYPPGVLLLQLVSKFGQCFVRFSKKEKP